MEHTPTPTNAEASFMEGIIPLIELPYASVKYTLMISEIHRRPTYTDEEELLLHTVANSDNPFSIESITSLDKLVSKDRGYFLGEKFQQYQWYLARCMPESFLQFSGTIRGDWVDEFGEEERNVMDIAQCILDGKYNRVVRDGQDILGYHVQTICAIADTMKQGDFTGEIIARTRYGEPRMIEGNHRAVACVLNYLRHGRDTSSLPSLVIYGLPLDTMESS